MAKFREILRNRNFFFFWLGQIASHLGDRLNQVALIALISTRAPGSSLQLAKLLSFTMLPVFLVGPVACSFVDCWDRRRTMIFCELLRAALVISLALFFIKLANIWPIYIVIFLIFSVSRFFVPAKMALLPQLVAKEKLLLANSLFSVTGMIAWVVGFGLGGFIVEQVGSSTGFLLNATCYLLSGLFIFLVALRIKAYASDQNVQQVPKQTLFDDIKEGWQYLIGAQNMRSLARLFFLLGAAAGAVSVAMVVFVQKTLGSLTKDLGILAMLLGAGLFTGALFYGRFGQKLSKIKIIFLSLGISGIALVVLVSCLKVFASASLAALLSFVLGLAFSPIIISSYTLIHEAVAEKLHGRIFGSLDIAAYLGMLLFMFLSSFLAEKIGQFWILLFVGVILAIVGFGAVILKVDKKHA